MSSVPRSRPTRRRRRRCARQSLAPIVRSSAASRNKPPVGTSSMWRDLNCFNEMRIPSLTYGPGVSVGGGIFRMPIETLITGSKLYVTTALDLCSQDRK